MIFFADPNITRIIDWSEAIEKPMIQNKDRDKELAWQYFCSYTGFMRQYPSSNWTFKPVDSFDCRVRPWYLNGKKIIFLNLKIVNSQLTFLSKKPLHLPKIL